MAPRVIREVLAPPRSSGPGGPFDLVTLVAVKAELDITTKSSDSWLADTIRRASAAVARYCNRIFQVQTYQDRIWAERDPYPWQVPGGLEPLQLGVWPLAGGSSGAGTPPPKAPVLGAVAGGASATAVTYFARLTYLTPTGETAASLESTFTVPAASQLTIAAPGADRAAIATGWASYVGTSPFGEVQQATGLGLAAPFTLTAFQPDGAAPPAFVLAVENALAAPQPLAEGTDFLVDGRHGQLTRLFLDGTVRRWPTLPLTIVYQAGFDEIPSDVEDATLRLVKARWFARLRDPGIRSENAAGVYEAAYWFGNGPGSTGDLPPDVMALLDRFRVPVMG